MVAPITGIHPKSIIHAEFPISCNLRDKTAKLGSIKIMGKTKNAINVKRGSLFAVISIVRVVAKTTKPIMN